MNIDRYSHVSMYIQISNYLEKQILSGHMKPNEQLPTETQLMETYNVSRMTVRLALKNLSEKGLVIGKRGKGTFVVDSLIHHDLGSMEAFYDSFKSQDIEAKLAEMKVIKTPSDVLERLGQTFNKCFYLKRLYSRKKVALGYAHIYLPVDLSKNVTWQIAEQQSGYSLLTQYGGVKVKNAKISIHTLPCQDEQSGELNTGESYPVLRLTRTSFSIDEEPIEFLNLFLRADICEFNFNVSSNFSIEKGIRIRK